jgi:hypothetical protein
LIIAISAQNTTANVGVKRALGKARMPDNETSRKVSIDYTLAAIQALEQNFSPNSESGKKFRFVYLSGAGAEKDQEKSLWVMQDYRRIRVCILFS